MQRIVLDIPDNKFNFIIELLKNLGIKKVLRLSPQQNEYVDGLNSAMDEVEEHLKGDKYLQNAKDFLEEL
jgi:predicted phosphatase